MELLDTRGEVKVGNFGGEDERWGLWAFVPVRTLRSWVGLVCFKPRKNIKRRRQRGGWRKCFEGLGESLLPLLDEV